LNAYSIDNVQIVADGLDHPECVAWHPDGSLWAGGEAGQIYRIDPKGRVEEVANTGGFILGLAFSPDCEWLAICDLRKRCVWRLDIDNLALDIFSTGAEDHSFNIPNFPCFDRSGSLYVSESGAFRTTTGKVLRFDSAGYGEVWSDGPFNFANGLALSPDEKHLYVVSSFLPGIERVAIAADGSAGRREVVVELPGTVPDGIAFELVVDEHFVIEADELFGLIAQHLAGRRIRVTDITDVIELEHTFARALHHGAIAAILSQQGLLQAGVSLACAPHEEHGERARERATHQQPDEEPQQSLRHGCASNLVDEPSGPLNGVAPGIPVDGVLHQLRRGAQGQLALDALTM